MPQPKPIETGFLLDVSADRRNYRKDAIRTGHFVHPSTGQSIDMSLDRLEKLQDNVRKMVANGVNIPIYQGHPNPKKPDTFMPLGNVDAAMIVDNTLFLDHAFADDDAATLAKRARCVSIKTNPAYVDCNGVEYGEVIEHVAVTAEPVITGQGEFLELSRASDDDVELSRNDNQNEENQMPPKLLEKLGLTADADEATIMAKFEEVTSKPAEVALSRESIECLTEAGDVRFEALVKAGRLSPVAAKELKLALVGEDKKENVLCLSRGSGERSLFNTVLDILEKNEAVALGEQTPAQAPADALALSRGESTPAAPDAAAQKVADEAASDRLSGLVNGE